MRYAIAFFIFSVVFSSVVLSQENATAKVVDKEPVSFVQAVEQGLMNSYKRQAAASGAKASALQRDAVKYLYTPRISLSGNASRYHYYQEMDTSQLRQNLNQFGGALDQSFKAVSGGAFPNKFNTMGDNLLDNPYITDKTKNSTKGAVSLFWPVYTGGRIDGIKALAKAKAIQASSELQEVEQTLYTTMAERYFGVQLAKFALQAREKALQTIKQHDHLAKRMYEKGLIAKYQRLKAQVALADAKQEVAAANNRMQLASMGLAQLVKGGGDLSSPLFVDISALKPVEYYQNRALKTFVGMAKLDAKASQVEAMKSIRDAALLPTVSVFARHELKQNNPQWIVGVNVSYTLWSNVNRFQMLKASSLQKAAIDAMRQQIHSDIKLLVHKYWLATQDALSRFHSHSSKLALAKEQAALRRKGFAQGLNTALEAIDAETELAKVRTERAKAAYDYILALAQLLETTGVPQELLKHQQQATLYISELSL